jgi:outer membrane PBP1 activator LpoA protein
MKKIIVPVLAAFFFAGCVSNPITPSTPVAPAGSEIQRANTLLGQGKEAEAADLYYRAALNSPSPQRERLILQAAEIATYIKDTSLSRHYLSKLGNAPLTVENKARHSYVKASIALLENNPGFALKVLPQQRGSIPAPLWSKINRIRKQALNYNGNGNQAPAQTGSLPQTVNKVAVLLPLSGKLSVIGNTILQGIQTSRAGLSTDTSIKTYDVSSADVLSQYKRAVAEGADVVVGPLDKRKLEALTKLGNLPRPVVGLNQLNQKGVRYASLFQFGLSPEDEAYQMAQFALSRGYRRAAVMYPDSQWGNRLAQAFESSYARSGGVIAHREAYPNTDPSYAANVQRALQSKPEMIFLAASPTQARLIRPMIQHKGGSNLPVFATSHIYSGRPEPGKNVDLDGIVYAEIPYILETASAGTSLIESKYPRLYAMGADAMVIAKNIAQMANSRQPLQGKTGTINIDGKNVLHRKLGLGTFANGNVLAYGE